MSETDDFYLILPSNSNLEMYPTNVTGNYITHLPHEIQLRGRWSVALVEMQVPYNFLHLKKEDSRIICMNTTEEVTNEIRGGLLKFAYACEADDSGLYHPSSSMNGMRYDMFHGFCKSPEELIDNLNLSVNRVFSAMAGHIGVEYAEKFKADIEEVEKPSEHIRFELKHGFVTAQCVCKCPTTHYICFSEKMRRILGLKRRMLFLSRDRYTFQHLIGLNRAVPDQLFVYCDLTEPHVVGNSVSPLLRVVPLENASYGSNIVKTFVSPHYYPLLRTTFRTIELDIRNGLGEIVPFESGTLICSLHLKKVY